MAQASSQRSGVALAIERLAVLRRELAVEWWGFCCFFGVHARCDVARAFEWPWKRCG